jgi:DNA replication protein DnaC
MRNEEDWKNSWRATIVKMRFSPRIQTDLEKITEPKDLPNTIESVYIYGETGSGKTILAALMLLEEEKQIWLNNPEDEFGHHIDESKKCEFISVPVLLNKIRNSYNNTNPDESPQKLIEHYSNIHLLVLDDFGVEKSTDWVLEILYLIINNRYEGLRKTIFTSNLDLKQLAASLGDDRIPARIERMGKVLKKTPYFKLK